MDTLTKLHHLYNEGLKVATPAQVVDVVELWWRVTESERGLEDMELQLQTAPDLSKKTTTLWGKDEKMLWTTTRLQSVIDVVFRMIDDLWKHGDKTKEVVTERMARKNWKLEQEAER